MVTKVKLGKRNWIFVKRLTPDSDCVLLRVNTLDSYFYLTENIVATEKFGKYKGNLGSI